MVTVFTGEWLVKHLQLLPTVITIRLLAAVMVIYNGEWLVNGYAGNNCR